MCTYYINLLTTCHPNKFNTKEKKEEEPGSASQMTQMLITFPPQKKRRDNYGGGGGNRLLANAMVVLTLQYIKVPNQHVYSLNLHNVIGQWYLNKN